MFKRMWNVVYFVCSVYTSLLKFFVRITRYNTNINLNQMYNIPLVLFKDTKLYICEARYEQGVRFCFSYYLCIISLEWCNSKLFSRQCRQIVCHCIMHATINHKLLSLSTCNTLIACFHVIRI